MKFFNLLAMGMIVCSGVTVQAQTVFQQDFSAEQTAAQTDPAYYEFINLQKDADGNLVDKWGIVDGALSMENNKDFPCTNQTWQRAIKFRNLPLKEKTLYKMTFDINPEETPYDENTFESAPGYVDVKLMQGDENADICIIDAAGAEQRANIALTKGEPQTISKFFYFADLKAQNEKYEANCAGKELYAPEKFFAGINVYSPGKYTVDNFLLDIVDPSTVNLDRIEYNEKVMRVYFGDKINADELIAKSDKANRYILDSSCATVTVNGEEVDIESIEIQKDGYLYIFMEEEIYEEAEVKVSFKNPGDVSFVSWAGLPLDFSEAGATYNEDEELLSIKSFGYSAAVLLSSSILDNSFNLSETLDDIVFTYDHNVYNNGNLKAELKSGTTTTSLPVSIDGNKVIVQGGSFPKGVYTLSIINLRNAGTRVQVPTVSISFETGKVQVAKTIYTKLADMFVPSGFANQVPEGWALKTNNEERVPGTTYVSGGRTFEKTYGNGMYFRAGEGEEAYVITPAVEVTAGNTILRAFVSSWKNISHNVTVQVLDEADNVVAQKENVATTALNAEAGDAKWEFQAVDVEFESTGANYKIKVIENTLDGQGLFVKGGTFLKVVKTEGDSFTPEVVAEGKFSKSDYMPEHGTGWKIYRNDDRMRDPGTNGNWGGDDWTGGGGPRMKSNGSKGFEGGCIYLGGNCYATYGEYDVYTNHAGGVLDEEGQPTPEKTLDLGKAKYQVTYYIAGWKTLNTNIQLDIFNQEDGITESTPVYTRVDAVDNHINSGNGNVDAKKVQFFFDAPAAGKYILKFKAFGEGEGEAVFGNVSVETTASLGIQYAQMMDKALAPAREELSKANEKDEYRGATRDELASTVETYSTVDFHTVAEYDAAFENLENLVKAMQDRRINIDAYPTALQGIKDGLEVAQGTKYEALPQFPIVEKAYNDYKDVDYIAMSDEELAAAVGLMGNNGTHLKNMVDVCVPLLTKQMTELAAAIVALDETQRTNKWVVATENAITDDQDLVKNLKLLYTAILYKQMAEGNPFEITDEETLITEHVDIPASFLIQNPNFYCVDVPVGETNVAVSATAFPGWSVENPKGQITCAYNTASWGGERPTAVKPIVDCAARAGWGDTDFTIEQLINNLPVAMYEVGITIGEDGSEHTSYAYCGEAQNAYEGSSRDESAPRLFENVNPGVDNETMLSAIKLGANMHVKGGFINVDKATLKMVGKVEGFDYATAAKVLQAEIDKLLAGGVKGDVNKDGAVDADDLSIVIAVMRGLSENPDADVNNDTLVDADDLSTVIDIMRQ